MKFRVVMVCAVLVAGIAGFLWGRNDPARARKQLVELQLEYNEATFVDRVRNSDAVAVDLFLKAGMNPNLREPTQLKLESGYRLEAATPLMIAAWNGDQTLVDRLLEAGADAAAVAPDNVTALVLAAAGNHHSVVKRIAHLTTNQESKDAALEIALSQENEESVQALLANGADRTIADTYRDRLAQSRALTDMRQIGTAIETFSIDNNYYPTASNLSELGPQLTPYIRVLPEVDPWGNPYEVEATRDKYVIRCLGRNGVLDAADYGPTTDLDADIIFEVGSFVQWPEGAQS